MIKNIWINALLILFVITLTACGGDTEGTEDSENLVVADWGGSYTEGHDRAIFEPFEKEYDANISVETPMDYGKLKAMVDSEDVIWDVVNIDIYWALFAEQKGLLEPLDDDLVNKEGMIPEFVSDYALGADLYSNVIAYNTESFSEDDHPENWEEFWDIDKYPGARGLYQDAPETLEIALLADGVAEDELYPLDIDRAFESLDKLESRTDIIWWEGASEPPELLITGDVTASAAWNGQIAEAKDEGSPVDLEYNQGIMAGVTWAIPKGAKNQDLGMEFIDFATDPQPQADFVTDMNYLPANSNANDKISGDRKEKLGQTEELITQQIIRNNEYWGEHFEEVNERFQEWLIG